MLLLERRETTGAMIPNPTVPGQSVNLNPI